MSREPVSDTSESTHIALVVVNYGSHALVRQNVPPSTAGTDAQVVIVDSYSTAVERSRIAIAAADHRWDLVLPEANVGFGGGVNLGVTRALDAGAQQIVVLNPDARLDPGSLEILAKTVAENPMSLVAPPIFRPDGTVYSRGLSYLALADGHTSSRPPQGASRTWMSGACVAFSAELWAATGGMAEDYFLYWEDVDFSARVQAAGGTLLVADAARAVHDEGATHEDATVSRTDSRSGARSGSDARSGSGARLGFGAHSGSRARLESRAKSGTYYYYNIRNRMLYAARQLSADDQRRWRRSSLQAARAIVLQGGRRQLLDSTDPWISALRGIRDGLRGTSGPAHRNLAEG